MTELSVLDLDAAALRALAHPMRMRILRVLVLRKKVSATSLAEELGESTGATSYHLRQLARHGLVEQTESSDDDDSPATTGRKRKWWRMAVDRIHFSGFDYLADPETREAAGYVLREIEAERNRRMANWYATASEWSELWQKASSDSDQTFELSPKQLRSLADDLDALVSKYRGLRPGRGARMVDVQYAVFPSDDGTRA